MLEKTWLIPLALGLALTGSVGSTANPPGSPLAECRLGFKAAKARLAKLKVLAREDKSGDELGWVITRYDPSGLRPLGLKALAFEHELLTEEGEQSHSLFTTVEAGFAPARDAMLASRGLNKCLQPFAAPSKSSCMVAPSVDKTGMPGIWVREHYDKAQIVCRY